MHFQDGHSLNRNQYNECHRVLFKLVGYLEYLELIFQEEFLKYSIKTITRINFSCLYKAAHLPNRK